MHNKNLNSTIVWIDGTYGIGKTATANALQQVFQPYDRERFVFLESDEYYQNGLKDHKYVIGGCYPQNNKDFISDFRQTIESYASKKDTIIVVIMALTMDESKDLLLDYFVRAGYDNLHIILKAELETVIARINNSPSTRDKNLAKDNLKQNTKYLQDNYQDAKWVNTDGKTPRDVADCLAHIINQHIQTGSQCVYSDRRGNAEKDRLYR